MKAKKGYILRTLIALDQLVNVVVLNGKEDHTISGHVGYKSFRTKLWYWEAAENFINTLFWFDKNHCFNSIEWDLFSTKTNRK